MTGRFPNEHRMGNQAAQLRKSQPNGSSDTRAWSFAPPSQAEMQQAPRVRGSDVDNKVVISDKVASVKADYSVDSMLDRLHSLDPASSEHVWC